MRRFRKWWDDQWCAMYLDMRRQRDELRRYQAEASETIRVQYEAGQRWKAEAAKWKAKASHPSCRGVMPDDVVALAEQIVQIRNLKEVE